MAIQPPEDDGNETGGDSGEEDCNNPDRLCRRQLEAPAELFINKESVDCNEIFHTGNEVSENVKQIHPSSTASPIEVEGNVHGTDITLVNESSSTTNLPNSVELESNVPRVGRSTNKSKSKKREELQWEPGNLDDTQTTWKQPHPLTVLSLDKCSSPLEFFQLFFNEEIVESIVMHTVRYAASQNNYFSSPLSSDEMYCFLGVLILSGYVPLPRRRMFWELSDDSHNVLVANSIRRNRFEEIMRFFHVVDNDNLIPNDRMAKVNPLLKALNELFLLYAPLEKNLSVDEGMIPYFGRHGCKQHIHGKPIRFGFKAWIIATKLGYCLQTELYQGKKDKKENTDLLLGESVVVDLISKVKNVYPDSLFSIFCDNFFTSPHLLMLLQSKNVKVTGTVRKDRTGHCPLKGIDVIRKEPRGTFDSLINRKHGITAIRWHDNSVVTVLSSEFGVQPVRPAQRYSAAQKTKIAIPQPCSIHQYNNFMGGVDQLDSNVAAYRIAI